MTKIYFDKIETNKNMTKFRHKQKSVHCDEDDDVVIVIRKCLFQLFLHHGDHTSQSAAITCSSLLCSSESA